MKRWTKLARSVDALDIGVSDGVKDDCLSTSPTYEDICPRLIRIATEACRSPETSIILSKVVDLLDKIILDFQNKLVCGDEVDELLNKVNEISNNNDGSTKVKGFKKKEGRKAQDV